MAKVLALHVPATRAEPDCLEFIALRADDDPDRFALYERYVDEAAFQSHRATPHFRDYVEGRILPLLDERSFQRYLEVTPAGRRLKAAEPLVDWGDFGRIAQRESARFTRERSLVRSQVRPSGLA